MPVIIELPFYRKSPFKPTPEYIKQWIKTCLAQGGTPLFRPREPYVVTVVCYGGIGPEMTERWELDPYDYEHIKKYRDDLDYILTRYAPDLKRELERKFMEEYRKLLELKEKLGQILILEESEIKK